MGRQGQLLCHIWADAEWIEYQSLCDEDIVAEIVAALRAMFPTTLACHDGCTTDCCGVHPLVTGPAQAKVTRWAQDPFALGAYSELQHPSASEEDRSIYARTEGCLFFAGEGTAPSTAGAQCVDGAVLTGVPAAVRIAEES